MECICLVWSEWTDNHDRDCANANAPFMHHDTTVIGKYQKTRICLFRDEDCIKEGFDDKGKFNCTGKDRS